MTFVYAGNYREYQYYLNEMKLTPKEARYIHDEVNLWGIHKAKIIKYGTWYTRPDKDKIDRLINSIAEEL
jgi:hypothetical protein